MSQRIQTSPFATETRTPEPARQTLRDILWDRPVFRAPDLVNPRVVFDPLPFRTQLFGAARRICRLGER